MSVIDTINDPGREQSMANLTVAEKNYWRERIQARIERKIEGITAGDPGLMERIAREARNRAMESLGLAAFQQELDRIAGQRAELDRRDAQVRREMLARVRGVPAEDLDGYSRVHDHPEIRAAVARRQAVHEEELLASNELGRQVLRLRAERENLLDSIWLASSPIQIRTFWQKVNELLGEEPTALEREAMAIPAAGEEG
jgi:hypothetical protein